MSENIYVYMYITLYGKKTKLKGRCKITNLRGRCKITNLKGRCKITNLRGRCYEKS